jgi:hypothetical protein
METQKKLTKKEKYRQFVTEEFYSDITKNYINSFNDGFISMYINEMYNYFTWNHYFTRKYYGFLSDEEQMKITYDLFKELFNQVSSYVRKNPSIEGDYDYPFADWLRNNYEYITPEYYG